MKKTWVVIIIVLVILAGAFFMRHQLKTMLMGSPAPSPVQTKVNPTSSTAVPSDNIYKVATSQTLGKYLTDFDGKTLYVFDKDTPGVSNCTGQCLAVWPVYTSGATAQKTFPENITVIKASDGTTLQFAWNGKPLYYYAKDTKPGDTLGDGVGGVWHVAKP